jgi:hypothetical protein
VVVVGTALVVTTTAGRVDVLVDGVVVDVVLVDVEVDDVEVDVVLVDVDVEVVDVELVVVVVEAVDVSATVVGSGEVVIETSGAADVGGGAAVTLGPATPVVVVAPV